MNLQSSNYLPHPTLHAFFTQFFVNFSKLTRNPLERAWLDDEDYRDSKAGDDYYQEELEAPRAEAMMEVEFLEKEEEIGPSLGRVLSLSYKSI